MTTILGIHQKQDKIDQLYENLGLRATPLSAIGPFKDKEEALLWQRGMLEKLHDCEVIEPLGPDNDDSLWYGFSFEKE